MKLSLQLQSKSFVFAFAILAGIGFSATANRPEIVAHRGASKDAPENTLSSVKLGWEQNADGVEVDIYLTADNSIVCYHDETLERTSGDPRRIADTTLEDLKKLEAGAWKGPQWSGEPIPQLSIVLETIPENKRMFVEIKCGPEVTEQLVKEVKASGKSSDQIVFISFNAESCRAIKAALPNHKVLFLHGFKKDENGVMQPTFDELIAEAKLLGVDGIDISRKGPINSENVKKVRDANLFLAVYTVDDPSEAKKLFEAGVDSITTNVPKVMLDSFNEKESIQVLNTY